MSDFKVNYPESMSLSNFNTFSHSDGRLPQDPFLTFSETIDLWSHATLLFHSLEWEQALNIYRRILRQCGTDVRKGYLWFNIGAIRGVLGEYYLAAEAFAKAIKYEPDSAVAWYCLGIALFELDAYRGAKKAFDKCLRSFAAEERVDYHQQGLDFVLERIRVDWNCRQALLAKSHRKAGAPFPLDEHLCINGMPAGTLFEPPSFGTDDRVEITSVAETAEESGLRKETLLSVLAPSTAHQPQNVQLQFPTAEPLLTGPRGDDKEKAPSSSTWPRRFKLPTSLPFVTAKELTAVSKAPTIPLTSATRARAQTVPQRSVPSQRQPSTGVLYHEGPIISTEYIPTTTNLDAFMDTAPVALVQDPLSRYSHPSNVPAPLFIPQKPVQPPRKRTVIPSPTSVYSRPFASSPPPDPSPPAILRNSTKPKHDAATNSWLDATFPPPRWDSLPSHLRPARRPSKYQPRNPERQHPPFSSSYRSGPPKVVNNRQMIPRTPSTPSIPHDDTDPDAALFPPPERHRDSLASMDSFAIIGLGKQATRWEEGTGWINGVGMGAAVDEVPLRDQVPRDGNEDPETEKGKSRWRGLGSSLKRRERG